MAVLAAGATVSQAAVSIKCNGEEIPSDGKVTVYASDFKDEGFPEIGLNRWVGGMMIEVSGDSSLEASLVSNTQDMQFCPVGQSCFTLFADGDVYTGSGVINANPGEVEVHVVYSGMNLELPKVVSWLDVTIKDGSGDSKKVRLEFDTLNDSGVAEIITDSDSCDVYNLSGVKVLEKADAASVDTLPAGIYIVNGKKICVK